MTTPERGLFDEALDAVNHGNGYGDKLREVCLGFEQRLAEAEANAKDAREKEQRAIREYIELTAEANQLRARCGELEGLIRDCNQSTSLKSVPLIMLQCGMPRSQQERANDAWKELGKEMGFDGMSVRPSNKGDRFFTAEVIEQEQTTK